MDIPIIIALLVSEIISLILLYKIFKSRLALYYKIATLPLGLVPVIGPLVLIFILGIPTSQSLSYRNRHVGYSGENREHHERIQKELERKISILEGEIQQSDLDGKK